MVEIVNVFSGCIMQVPGILMLGNGGAGSSAIGFLQPGSICRHRHDHTIGTTAASMVDDDVDIDMLLVLS
jgi:hypothetical protein